MHVFTVTAYPDPESADFGPEDVEPFAVVYSTLGGAQQAVQDTLEEIAAEDLRPFGLDVPELIWNEHPNGLQWAANAADIGRYVITQCEVA